MRRVVLVGALVLGLLAGCTSTPFSGPDVTLRVLGGSELADMAPLLDQAEQATGIRVQLDTTGTLEGAEEVASGAAERDHDAIWFSSNSYLSTRPDAAARLGPSVPMMSSPVVLGLRRSVAQRLGWAGRPVTWAQIAQAAGQRRFTYGMTDPSSSNSGFSTLVAVATALAGTGSALTSAEATSTGPGLRGFFAAQTLTAGSSGYLVDAYTRRVTGTDPGAPVDGLVNYESVLLGMNDSGTLPEPLELVRPSDGVLTATYPFTVLNSASTEARDASRRLTEYLRTPDVQRQIMDRTGRRPSVGGIPLTPRFGSASLVELPFPARADVVDTLLATWFDRVRRPSRTLYVLDTSGSMSTDDRIGALRRAMAGLSGADPSLLGRYRAFRGREQVTLLPFNTIPGAARTFDVPETDPGPVRARIGATAAALGPGGDTAIYASLEEADRVLAAQSGADPDRFTSIVLMTDGENTVGPDILAYRGYVPTRPAAVRGVPVFCVLFGDSSESDMAEIARLTGGKTFDARSTPLERIFSEIRGYV